MSRKASAEALASRYLLLGSVIFLALFGLVMIYSASSVADYQRLGDSAYHLKKQLVWLLGSLALLGATWRLDYRLLRRFGWVMLVVADSALVAVLIIGETRYGAQRWVFGLQPSEFAKLACVLVTAQLVLAKRPEQRDLRRLAGPLSASVGVVVLLVMAQPDMGTSVSILLAVYLVLFLARTKGRDMAGLTIVGAAAIALSIVVAPYRFARLLGFLDPWADPRGKGYQIIQAMYAFGSGGVTGVGLGLSHQKFSYLPAAHTDFILAIVGEELGLVGTLSIVVAFALLAWAGFRIALKAKDPFGRLMAGGLTSLVVTQALINMAAVTGLMPVTGIPLPFVSFGGSSMAFSMLCVGVILSVQCHGTASKSGKRIPREKESPVEVPADRRRNGRPRLSSIDGGRRAAR